MDHNESGAVPLADYRKTLASRTTEVHLQSLLIAPSRDDYCERLPHVAGANVSRCGRIHAMASCSIARKVGYWQRYRRHHRADEDGGFAVGREVLNSIGGRRR